MRNNDRDIRRNWGMLIAAAAWVASYFLGRAVMEAGNVTTVIEVAVALLPILPFAAFVYFALKSQRGMDELQLRVQLEALAIAFPLSILFLMVFGLLGEALNLTLERHVWFYLPVFYFVGLALAWRRYQ